MDASRKSNCWGKILDGDVFPQLQYMLFFGKDLGLKSRVIQFGIDE